MENKVPLLIKSMTEEDLEKFKKLCDKAVDGLTIIDHGKVSYVNDRLCDILGYSKEDYLKLSGIELAIPEDKKILREFLEQAEKTGILPNKIEFWITDKDGKQKCIQNRYFDALNERDMKYRFIITSDITENKRLIEKLKEQRKNLELQVQERTREIRLINEKLVYEVIKRREAEEQLRKFITSATHEIRTPASILIQSVKLLQKYDESMTEAEKKRFMDAISKNVTLLAELLEDLLFLSRLEAQRIEIDWKVYKPHEVVQDTLNQLELVRKAKNIEIKVDISKNIELIGASSRIGQVFRIILDNAIKYSENNSNIEIRAINNYEGKFNPTKLEGTLIQIQDHGIGVHEKDIDKIFERFYRSDEVQHVPGTGLGLPIARELIHLHHGEIYVESELGKGSTFSIFLPRLKNQLT